MKMKTEMGGEVAEFIGAWANKKIRCFGVCHQVRVMKDFGGYEHDGGLADGQGKKWWVYFECPKCRYGHSFSKMAFFEKHTQIEAGRNGDN